MTNYQDEKLNSRPTGIGGSFELGVLVLMAATFYPLLRESRWSKDHDKLPQSASAPINGSEEAGGATKGNIEQI